MSFAENLQYLRKRKDITQEQLAEQLEVSRQSVSKWESAQSYPEMEKLLQICKMFHCSMDTLMQGDVSREFAEDTHGYDRFQNQFSRWVSGGVGLILLGVSVMSLLCGMGMAEMTASAIFFVFVIVAVLILVVMGMQYGRFREKHPQIEDFYTEAQKEEAYRKYIVRIALGVGIILVGTLFVMIGGDWAEAQPGDAAWVERLGELVGAGFMLTITVAVTILVYGGLQKGKYNIEEYNREGNPTPEKKRRDSLVKKLCACIMLAVTIILVLWGAIMNDWSRAGVLYAVGGLLCAIVAVVFPKDT